MAEKKENALSAKSSVTGSDFLRLVGSNGVSYKQLVTDVAKYIIESYAGSSIAGSSQSPKAAVDALKTAVDSLNSNVNTWYTSKEIYGAGAINDANNAPAPSLYVAYTTAANVPQQGILLTWGNNSGSAYKSQLLISGNKIYSRTYTTNSGWSSWYRFDGTQLT